MDFNAELLSSGVIVRSAMPSHWPNDVDRVEVCTHCSMMSC